MYIHISRFSVKERYSTVWYQRLIDILNWKSSTLTQWLLVNAATWPSFQLLIAVQPKILIDPLSKIRNEKQNVTLACHYEGKPVADAVWFRNDTRLDVSSDSRMQIARSANASLTESFLTIANLNRQDEGRYKCQVNNSVGGPATSQEAQLTVNCEYFNRLLP